MEEKDQRIIESMLETARKIRSEFFLFSEQTKIQLFSNQCQLLQSLATINLAFVAIALATKTFDYNIWWTLSVALSLILILYTITYIRVTNDRKSAALEEISITLEQQERDLEEKALDARTQDNIEIFIAHLRNPKKIQKSRDLPISYAGELAVFLFVLSLFSGVVGVLKGSGIGQDVSNLVIGVVIAVLAFFISAIDWNSKVTEIMSHVFHLILKREKIAKKQ